MQAVVRKDRNRDGPGGYAGQLTSKTSLRDGSTFGDNGHMDLTSKEYSPRCGGSLQDLMVGHYLVT
jgi:hypothetical protein